MILALLALVGAGVQAQLSPEHAGDFAKLFPNPTGKNAYEDWVRAGLLLSQHAEEVKLIANAELPLSQLRSVLAKDFIQEVRVLMQAGLSKSVRSPRDPKTLDFNTTFPEYTYLRGLSRLLFQEARLQLADGRNSQALATLREGLWMGKAIQMDVLIGGLVGVAMEAMVMTPFNDTLPTFSVKDCEALEILVRDYLTLPSALQSLMQAEREEVLRSVQQFRKDHASLLEMLRPDPSNPDTNNGLYSYFKENPNAIAPAMEQAEPLLNQFYEEVMRNIQRPAWERTSPSIDTKSLAGQIVAHFTPAMNQLFSRFDQERSRVLLLGIRAKLRRYWWEYGHFPATLEGLKLEEIILDPTSGKPFSYSLKGDTYELLSSK